jgi:hypothetical protein
VLVATAVTIRGAGDGTGVVIEPSTGAAFTLVGSGATLSNMTLRGAFGAVAAVGGAPTIEDLAFESVAPAAGGAAIPAIDVSGGSTAVVRGNRIVGGATGIRVADGMPLLEGNDIAGTGAAGIQVDGGQPQLTANVIHDNAGSGVVVAQGAPALSGNTITANATGLLLGGPAATPSFAGNTICGNAVNVQLLGVGPLPDLEVCPGPAPADAATAP